MAPICLVIELFPIAALVRDDIGEAWGVDILLFYVGSLIFLQQDPTAATNKVILANDATPDRQDYTGATLSLTKLDRRLALTNLDRTQARRIRPNTGLVGLDRRLAS